MTPDERQLITGLFERIRQQGAGEKDREAEALIRDGVRQMPDAPYMLVQTALVQEMALQQSENRVRELEDRIRELEDKAQQPAQQGTGSFLGGLFGGGAARPAASSVPAAGRQSSNFGTSPRGPAGSPWGNIASNANGPGPMPGPQAGYGQAMPMQPAGGGFLRSAMSTAAGVAGGVLAAEAISGMLGGHSAHATGGLFGSGLGNSDLPPPPVLPQRQASPHPDDVAAADGNDPGTDDDSDNDPGNTDDNDPGYDAGGGGDSGGGWDE